MVFSDDCDCAQALEEESLPIRMCVRFVYATERSLSDICYDHGALPALYIPFSTLELL